MTTVTPTSRRRHQRTPARWAAYVAPRIGMTPLATEALVHGHFPIGRRFAALVEAAVVLDDRRLLDKLMAPVDAALAKLPDRPLSPDLQHAAQVADLAEDVAEAAYHATPCPETRRAFASAIRAERAALLPLLMALEAL